MIRGGGTLPSYPVHAHDDFKRCRRPLSHGQHYVKVSYPSTLISVGGGMDSYNGVNKPYLDFFKEFMSRSIRPAARAVGSSWATATTRPTIIRGPGVPTPPDSNQAVTYHIGNDEFWFVLEGKIDYLKWRGKA